MAELLPGWGFASAKSPTAATTADIAEHQWPREITRNANTARPPRGDCRADPPPTTTTTHPLLHALQVSVPGFAPARAIFSQRRGPRGAFPPLAFFSLLLAALCFRGSFFPPSTHIQPIPKLITDSVIKADNENWRAHIYPMPLSSPPNRPFCAPYLRFVKYLANMARCPFPGTTSSFTTAISSSLNT